MNIDKIENKSKENRERIEDLKGKVLELRNSINRYRLHKKLLKKRLKPSNKS